MTAMGRKGFLVAALIVAALAVSTASAQAAVTIGSRLQASATTNMPGCNIPCTVTNLALPLADIEQFGLTSPVNGTVTSWRVKANTGPNLRLRVLRPAGSVAFTGVGTSGPAGFAGPGVSNPIPTSLPIKVGDSIGVDNPNSNLILATLAGATTGFWNVDGPLTDGATRIVDGTGSNTEVLVQATIEPSNTVTFGAVIRNKKKGTARITVGVPNAGQLVASGTGVKTAANSSLGPSDLQLALSATGKKQRKLRKTGKVTIAPSFTFTPNNGAAGTSSTSLKLVKKLKRR
jgi:hypothetical protein